VRARYGVCFKEGNWRSSTRRRARDVGFAEGETLTQNGVAEATERATANGGQHP